MQDPEFRNTVPRLTVDGNDIDNVQHAKLLGVTISSDLTWNKHVENIVAKAGKRVYTHNTSLTARHRNPSQTTYLPNQIERTKLTLRGLLL